MGVSLPPLEVDCIERWGDISFLAAPMYATRDRPDRSVDCWSGAEREQKPPPPAWLTKREQAVYAGFAYPLRSHEWLTGRFVAKRLCARLWSVAPSDVEVLPEPSDAPALFIHGARATQVINITHTRAYAAALVSPTAAGIDLCDVTDGHRLTKIARRVMADGEEERTRALGDDERSATVWALKEAGLKARIGGVFSPGARSVEVESLAPIRLRDSSLSACAWRLPLSVLAVVRVVETAA